MRRIWQAVVAMACSNSGCNNGTITAPNGKSYPCPQCNMPDAPDED